MQDGLEQAAPVDAIDELTKEQLAYVAEVSKNARTTWFGLIGLLLFCGVTLLDVQDRDFFEYGASTQLPLINVSVPTANFFWAAPLLVTGLYTYLHLYLDKLWKALRPLGNDIGGKPVTQVVYPWLISDTALERREGVTRGPYWSLTRFVTLCLCWLIGPVAMALFWMKSWAPHDEVLTTVIGLQLAWLCMVGVNSWLGMCRETNAASCAVPVEGSRFLNGSIFVLLAWTVGAYGWAKTEDGRVWALRGEANPETAYLYSAGLYRANFVKPDKDWKGREAAWRGYQRAHRDQVIAELSREKNGETDVTEKDISARLKTEFEEDRGETRASLERRDYNGQDLRGANLREAMLAGLDLRKARLEGADLREARLEGADLEQARLEGADLMEARLEGAELRLARLEGADLTRVEMTDAVVKYASVIGATLSQVSNLTQAQLDQMYGDKTTDLSETGLGPPAHWPEIEISVEQRVACWNEWAVENGVWELFLPETDVQCTIQDD